MISVFFGYVYSNQTLIAPPSLAVNELRYGDAAVVEGGT